MAEIIGTWHEKEFPPFPPEFINNWQGSINTFAEWLISSLEIANAILDVIKTFAIDINDPITVLVKTLIAELKQILRDLRQIGLYFTSDRKISQYPFKDLLGGFANAEKRMIGRLTDRTDVGRPNVSPNTMMLGFMFYLSANTENVYLTISKMNKILGLFSSFRTKEPFPPIGNLTVSYVASNVSYRPRIGDKVFSPPRRLTVKWTQKAPNPVARSKNFIVEVSTVPFGLPIYVLKQDTNKGSSGGTPSEGTPQLKTYPITYTHEGSERPLYLFGGADRLDYDKDPNYENAVDEEGKLKEGYACVYTFLPENPSQPIPIHLLKDNDNHYLQKTFVIGKDADKIGNRFPRALRPPNQPMSLTIDQSELPKNMKIVGEGSYIQVVEDTENPPTTYFFRVTPSDEFGVTGAYQIFEWNINREVNVASLTHAEGTPSNPYRLLVARDNTAKVQEAIESAFTALVLSRPDQDFEDRVTPFLDSDKERMQSFFGVTADRFFSRDMKILNFRKVLRNTIKKKTYEIMNSGGILPERVEQFIVDNSEELRNFTWGDFNVNLPDSTLRQSVGLDPNDSEFTDTNTGVAPNTKSMTRGFPSKESKLRRRIQDVEQDQPPSLVPTRATIELPFSEYNDQVFKLRNKIANADNLFVQANDRTLDYLQNGALKNEDGSLFTLQREGVEFVYLYPQSKYFALKKRGNKPTDPNGNSPLVFGDRDAHLERLNIPQEISNLTNPLFFTRTILLNHNDGQVLEQSALVLNLVTASIDKKSESDWDYVRIGEVGAFQNIDKYLAILMNSMLAFQQGLESASDRLERQINFLQQRILEMQNLIRKLNALIQSLDELEIPTANLLLFASNGTDGVLTDLVMSQNKPQDSNKAIGFGAMGLVPLPFASLILDLLYPDTDINDLLTQVEE